MYFVANKQILDTAKSRKLRRSFSGLDEGGGHADRITIKQIYKTLTQVKI